MHVTLHVCRFICRQEVRLLDQRRNAFVTLNDNANLSSIHVSIYTTISNMLNCLFPHSLKNKMLINFCILKNLEFWLASLALGYFGVALTYISLTLGKVTILKLYLRVIHFLFTVFKFFFEKKSFCRILFSVSWTSYWVDMLVDFVTFLWICLLILFPFRGLKKFFL
jgi:hypothetical protein